MLNKKQRIAAISALLVRNPNKLFPLNGFQEMFHAAKSSVSEDISVIRQSLEQSGAGRLETVAGSKGGVRYLPVLAEEAKKALLDDMIEKMSDPSRILPGGFVYVDDLFCTPQYVDGMAPIMAEWFAKSGADFIVTVETKGIPLAMNVARILNLPVSVVHKSAKLTDGPVFSVNYLSGSSRRLQTMSLSKRMIQEGRKALVIDDFIAGGGTIKAVCDMLGEFNIEVVGIGVAIANKYPQKKKVKKFRALFLLEELSEAKIKMVPYL